MLKKLLKKLNTDKIRPKDEYNLVLSDQLQQTVASIKNIIGESDDIDERNILIAKKIPATLFFFSGLSNEDSIDINVIKPLIQLSEKDIETLHPDKLLHQLKNEVIDVSSIKIHDSFDQAIPSFMSGDALLVINGVDKLIILGTRKFEKRAVTEPQSEVVIRGPRDGFTEILQTNIILLRQKIKDINLTVQIGQIGRRNKKGFALVYIKGITNEDLIEEVRYRISCIDIDDVPETGTIEQLIEENVFSPFPQMSHTERPDRTVAALMNGQVAILVDGTPFSLIAPVTLQQLMKSPEDYYERWLIGTFVRFLRYGAAFLTLFLPAMYIAMLSYHQGMIPKTLALSIAGTREGVPFPVFVEALIMETTFELLREAGNRLPRPIGQTIGIVGGLVIGDAAVRAGVVSPVMVIVVALTAVASFALPTYDVSISFRLLRFVLMFAAAAFGLYGIIIVYLFLNIHLVGLRSFGSYYTSPFAPYRFADWLDLVVRAPIALLRVRLDEPRTLDDHRQKSD
jgi:spore germination protein